jgi:ABC-type antimicrobial peptide transport system permease subunit
MFGLSAAALLTPLLSDLLYGIGARDPMAFSAAAALQLTAAVLASAWPARRAASIAPLEALREQ